MALGNGRRVTRRQLLRMGGLGALALAGGNSLLAAARAGESPLAGILASSGSPQYRRLAATDGHISLPGRVEPLYVFGFVEVPVDASIEYVTNTYKGFVQAPAPILGVDQDHDLYLTLTNIGLVVRPDLDDSHTVHWHGFRNPLAIFDGVPEVSISVPVGRDFPYFYRPHDPGTYMYHCHFEDVEHVQMGMTGIVFVRPALGPRFAYNDPSTAFDREFALLLSEIDTRPHDNLELVQEFMWTNYKPNYFVINGRAYPDTIEPNVDEPIAEDDEAHPLYRLRHQPISSLVQINEGETGLLRFANLGYDQHAMQITGVPMKVVGEDATLLRGTDGTDLSYWTNTIYIGPGEARDVLFTAPAYDAAREGGTDGAGSYNRYLLKNRSYYALTNDGSPGLGGMLTEVRVYPAGTLAGQTRPNETYG